MCAIRRRSEHDLHLVGVFATTSADRLIQTRVQLGLLVEVLPGIALLDDDPVSVFLRAASTSSVRLRATATRMIADLLGCSVLRH